MEVDIVLIKVEDISLKEGMTNLEEDIGLKLINPIFNLPYYGGGY